MPNKLKVDSDDPGFLSWPKGVMGHHIDKGFVAVEPHEKPNYWHVTAISRDWSANGTKRGVSAPGARLLAEDLSGCPLKDFRWWRIPGGPSRYNHYIAGLPIRGCRAWIADSVYFIQADIGGPIKIGAAGDVDARIKLLQVGSPFPLVLLGVIPDIGVKGERAIHAYFDVYRLHGEWFEDTPEIHEYIVSNCENEVNAL